MLLHDGHRTSSLDFRGISKNYFHLFSEQCLPLLVDRIAAIHLCNGDETPHLGRLFLCYQISLNRFIHLQSLSLYDMCSIDMTIQMIQQCPQIRRLNLTRFYIIYQEQTRFPELIQKIWKLPNLVDCCLKNLNTCPELDMEFTVVSTSIRHLIIDDVSFRCDLLQLLDYTPSLTRLSLDVFRPSMHSLGQTIFPAIVTLDIKLSRSHAPFDFLYSMPNLFQLKFELYGYPVVGSEWERLITTYLPQLCRFELKMNFLESTPNLERVCIQLLNTFRTPFWLEERQWFVRCVGFFACTDNAIFYTLPFTFDRIPYINECWSYSTSPTETVSLTSTHVTSIDAMRQPLYRCEDLHRLPHHYPNLRELSCHLGCLKTDLCPHPLLTNHLTSISIVLFDDSWLLSLQTLLDSSPHLYSLTIFFMLTVYMKVFELQSSSLRRLNVYRQSIPYTESTYLSENEYELLANSFLGQQCEVLSIIVQKRSQLIDLMKRMKNLRSINVQLEDDTWQFWYPLFTPSRVDELIKWLNNQFPSSYSIRRNSKKSSLIEIWIG